MHDEILDEQHLKHKKNTAKPDPLFKAKLKAKSVRDERDRKRKEIQEKFEKRDATIRSRKKRHVKMSLRTATGQPVIKNQITDILAKLQGK